MKKLFLIAAVSTMALAACSGNSSTATGTDSTVTNKVSSDSISSGAATDSTKMTGSSSTSSSSQSTSTDSTANGKVYDSTSKNWIDKGDKNVTKQGEMVKKPGY